MASIVSGVIEQIQTGGTSGTKHAIASTAYGYCETAANVVIKNVDMTGFKLEEGVTIHVKFANNNSASNPKLKFNSEADTEAKPIVQYGTTAVGGTNTTNGWNAGAVLTLTYDGARWIRDQGFNTDTTNISHLYMQYGGDVAANLLCRYQLIFENAEHKFVSIYGTDNAYDATNKTLLTVDFDPNGRIYYHNTSGTTAANANINPGRLYYSVLADLRYSFNISSSAVSGAFTGTRYLPLYLKTQMTASTGMVHIASNQPLVTSLPTTADNYYYIYLGQIHDWYRVMLEREHPVYYHNGTEVVKYLGKTSVDFSNDSAHSEKITVKFNTNKAYLLGSLTAPTSAGVEVTPVGDTGVYLTAGQLNATSYKVNEKVIQSWNATSQCLEFQFV